MTDELALVQARLKAAAARKGNRSAEGMTMGFGKNGRGVGTGVVTRSSGRAVERFVD